MFGVMRVDFQHVLGVPAAVLGAPRLRAHIVLRQYAAGGEQQREARPVLLVGRHIFRDDELALAAHESVDVHDRRAIGCSSLHGHCTRAYLIELLEGHAGEGRRQAGDLVHDLARDACSSIRAHGVGDQLGDFPVAIAVLAGSSPCARAGCAARHW